jgi:hypothetical protein
MKKTKGNGAAKPARKTSQARKRTGANGQKNVTLSGKTKGNKGKGKGNPDQSVIPGVLSALDVLSNEVEELRIKVVHAKERYEERRETLRLAMLDAKVDAVSIDEEYEFAIADSEGPTLRRRKKATSDDELEGQEALAL